MRVALDVTPLLGAPTGIGTFARAAGTALIEAGQNVVGYGLTGRGHLRSQLPTGIQPGRSVPAAVALAVWGRGSGWITAEWLAAGPVDVVHGTNFVVPPARAAARVVTVHDLTAVRFPQMCAPASRRYPELVRRATREGAWVHTPSAFVAREVVELLGVAPDRVRPVAHGVDHFPKVIDGRPRGRDVVALGTVEPRKDLPLLVRAFDRVAAGRDDVRLVIAGADGWGASQLDDAVRTATHADRIVRLGYVDDARRAELMAEAGVFAYPSRYEGFGLPPLEAMAAGVPVVASDAGAIPEVVGDGALLVAVGDEEGLAAALSDVLDDQEVSASLVARGKARAAQYTWTRCAAGLVALYEEAIACK